MHRRITSSHPNDPRQPFYDPSGQAMEPLAKITITRQRLYKNSRLCGEDDGGGDMGDDGDIFITNADYSSDLGMTSFFVNWNALHMGHSLHT